MFGAASMTELRNLKVELRRFKQRTWVAGILVLLAFSILGLRLVTLQVLRHERLSEQAESNRTTIVPVVPHRGWILDRNGVVLASNYSAYTLEITPADTGTDDMDALVAELGKIVRIEPRDIRRFKKLLGESKNFESISLRSRLNDEEVARLTAQRYRFPGVEIQARLFRSYPLGETASHVVGYIGRINQQEKEMLADMDPSIQANYKGTDYIGKLGIEQSFEKNLHGQAGVEQVETSAGGRATRQLGATQAKPGENIVLSIDIKLQKMVEEMFGDRRGALVAIDPNTGEVLAFVSKPTFDPNLFVDGIDVENWRALNESINRPLLNRALRGTYPPGSTFKPFMALCALELGIRKAETAINDPGYWMFGKHRFRSHGDGGLGSVNMYRSIVKSSNVYYYSLANEMGVEAMHDFMAPLGFGQLTGIDLNGEVRGLLPNQAWKRERFKNAKNQKKRDWVPGETISLGIGQGYNNFTILQLAHATSILANGGRSFRPHLALATQDLATGQRTAIAQPPPTHLGYKPEHIEVIRRALAGVVREGTAQGAFRGASYISAGKTGTAQAASVGQKERYDARRIEEHKRDHALYMAFAPADKPTIAVAAIVENAGFGAAHAAPMARRVFDYWLLGDYPSEADMALLKHGKAGPPIAAKQRKAVDVPLLPNQGTLVLSDSGLITEKEVPPPDEDAPELAPTLAPAAKAVKPKPSQAAAPKAVVTAAPKTAASKVPAIKATATKKP